MNDKDQEFNFTDLSRLLRRWKLVIVGCIVIVAIFMTLVALASYPVYESKGSFQLSQQTNPSGLLTEMLSFTGGTSQLNAELEIVKSRSIADAIIQKFSLDLKISDVTYASAFSRAVNFVLKDRMKRSLRSLRITDSEFPQSSIGEKFFVQLTDENGGFRVSGKSGELGAGKIGELFQSESISFTVTSFTGNVGTKFQIIPQKHDDALQAYYEVMRAATKGGTLKTNIIEIAFNSTDPTLAADVVNGIITEYQTRDKEWKKIAGTSYSSPFKERLDKAIEDLAAAEVALEEYKNRTGTISITEEARLVLNNLATREAERVNLDIRLSMLKNLYSSLSTDIYADNFTIPPALAADPLIQQLATEHARLTTELADLLLDYTPGHPRVVAEKEAITGVRNNIIQILKTTIDNLERQQSEIIGVIGDFEAQLNKMPGAEKSLVELTRNRDVNEAIFKDLTQKYETAQLYQKTIATENRLIDRAFVPQEPIYPSIKKNLVMGLGLGLILGLLLALLLEIFGKTVHHPDELTDLFDRSNIAYVMSGSEKDIAKATGLLALALMKSRRKLICILSPSILSDEKRSVIENAVTELAQHQHPVLLLDTDSEIDKSSYFNSPLSPGIYEISMGSDIKPIQCEKGRVLLIPPGKSAGSAMVASKILSDKIELLVSQSALGIIASGNVESDPSARGWANLSDGVILLLKRNEDKRASIIELTSALKSENIPVNGAILIG